MAQLKHRYLCKSELNWAAQEESGADTESVASFTGSISDQKALFTGLRPGEDYLVAVVVSPAAAQLLAPANLLFIAQVEANSSGRTALTFVSCTDESATVRAFGPEPEPTPTPTPTSTPTPTADSHARAGRHSAACGGH